MIAIKNLYKQFGNKEILSGIASQSRRGKGRDHRLVRFRKVDAALHQPIGKTLIR